MLGNLVCPTEKGQASVGEGLQVPEHHEEFSEEIRDSGAEEGGERGCDGGRRERDQTRHQRSQMRADRDPEEFRHEHVDRQWYRYW